MLHGYLASTSYADKLAGDVLTTLKNLKLEENTIIVIWGDHGWHLGEHDFWGKHNTMHLSTRVPLIIKVPGKSAAVTESLVEVVDLFPTLCELAGIEAPETTQGRSFTSLFDQPGKTFRDCAFCRFNQAENIVTKRFSYTNFGTKGREMLYDLEKDPQENTNLAKDPEHSETLERMKGLLKQRKQESDR